MGRYYSGDIEGKFWFGVQKSDDANFFGVSGSQPEMLNYYYGEEDLKGVEEGIAECINSLGKNKEKIDKFFDGCDSYNEQMIEDETGINKEEIKVILEWYARLILGKNIQKCLQEHGSCEFDAEL